MANSTSADCGALGQSLEVYGEKFRDVFDAAFGRALREDRHIQFPQLLAAQLRTTRAGSGREKSGDSLEEGD